MMKEKNSSKRLVVNLCNNYQQNETQAEALQKYLEEAEDEIIYSESQKHPKSNFNFKFI